VALAEMKAKAVSARYERGLIIGADTIVVIEGRVLGKPADDQDAVRMLRTLSGRTHQVITGVAVVDAASHRTGCAFECTRVTFRPLSDAQIARYVASGEPADKAGAYG